MVHNWYRGEELDMVFKSRCACTRAIVPVCLCLILCLWHVVVSNASFKSLLQSYLAYYSDPELVPSMPQVVQKPSGALECEVM